MPEITGRVRSVAARADELVKNGKLDESAAGLQHAIAEADQLLATQSDNVRAILTDLRATMANARALTDEIKANPSSLVFSKPPPRSAYGGTQMKRPDPSYTS
jgi:multidrug resistance efflux pump